MIDIPNIIQLADNLEEKKQLRVKNSSTVFFFFMKFAIGIFLEHFS